jgi:cysteine desulfurase
MPKEDREHPLQIRYLDNNATTRPSDEVVEAVRGVLATEYGNPSSMHVAGARAATLVDEARRRVARLISAPPEQIVVTSGGTESVNLAIRAATHARPDRRHAVISAVEHSSVRRLCRQLRTEGFQIDEAGVDSEGRLRVDNLAGLVTDQTAFVSILHANNETGVVFPVEEVAEIVRSSGACFHVDAVQTVGRISVCVNEKSGDLMSFSAHKFHGPKGVGGLYVRPGVSIKPLLIGGHQERDRRAGTENTPGIAGMGVAAETARLSMDRVNPQIAQLRDRLQQGILSRFERVRVLGTDADRMPNTCNACFESINAEALLILMSELGICASSGAACSSGGIEPSHVLEAMGVPEPYLRGSIRFSLSRYSTAEDVDFVLDRLPDLVSRASKIQTSAQLTPVSR